MNQFLLCCILFVASFCCYSEALRMRIDPQLASDREEDASSSSSLTSSLPSNDTEAPVMLPNTSLPYNASNWTFLSGSEGKIEFKIKGYGYRAFRLPSPDITEMAIDTVVNIHLPEETADPTENCHGWQIEFGFDSVKPLVMPRTIAASESDGDGSTAPSLLPLFGSSIMCRQRPELGQSIKNTNGREDWYVLIQTRGGEKADSDDSTCVMTFYWNEKSVSYRRLKFVLVMSFLLLFSLIYIVYMIRVFRRPTFHYTAYPISVYETFAMAPSKLVQLCMHLGTFIVGLVKNTLEQRRRKKFARERRAAVELQQQERGLITPRHTDQVRTSLDVAASPHNDDLTTEGGSLPADVTEEMKAMRTPTLDPTTGEIQVPETPPTPSLVVPPSASEGSRDQREPTLAEDDDDEGDTCRICRDDEALEKLISPCDCIGSVKWVHRSCLDRWRVQSAQRNPRFTTHCEICKAPFRIGIEGRTFSKLFATKFVVLVLFIIASLLCLMLTFLANRVSFAILSCSAPYHAPATANPFTIRSACVGFLMYMLFCLILHAACLFAWNEFLSRPDVHQAVETFGELPPFWNRGTYATVAQSAVIFLVLASTLGYALKFALYQVSRNIVWSWELQLTTGLMCLGVIMFLVGVLVIAKIMISIHRGGRNGGGAEHHAPAAVVPPTTVENNTDGNDDDADEQQALRLGVGPQDHEALNVDGDVQGPEHNPEDGMEVVPPATAHRQPHEGVEGAV